MQTFFKVKSTVDIYKSLSDIEPLGIEKVHITNTLNRVLATDIIAQEDLPGFDRSTVDGYALMPGTPSVPAKGFLHLSILQVR